MAAKSDLVYVGDHECTKEKLFADFQAFPSCEGATDRTHPKKSVLLHDGQNAPYIQDRLWNSFSGGRREQHIHAVYG